jgi:hypothetical protein
MIIVASVGLTMGVDAVQYGAHQGGMDLAEDLVGQAAGALLSGIMPGYQ